MNFVFRGLFSETGDPNKYPLGKALWERLFGGMRVFLTLTVFFFFSRLQITSLLFSTPIQCFSYISRHGLEINLARRIGSNVEISA